MHRGGRGRAESSKFNRIIDVVLSLPDLKLEGHRTEGEEEEEEEEEERQLGAFLRPSLHSRESRSQSLRFIVVAVHSSLTVSHSTVVVFTGNWKVDIDRRIEQQMM